MGNKILTICLPTYRRSRCIGEQLERLSLVDKSILDRVEIIVSDNCSPDDTQRVVESYKDKLDFTFFRNKENIGAEGNFLQCLNNAHGKYAWLLGDDDFLEHQNLGRLLDELNMGNYGLVHIKSTQQHDLLGKTYPNFEDFLIDIGVYITFMSANIINMQYFSLINLEKYLGSFFIQMPLFINSAIHGNENRMLNFKMFESDSGNQNGGYNIFRVFIVNYLKIFNDFIGTGKLDNSFYEREVKVSEEFMLPFMYRILIKKEQTGWSKDDAWDILNKYFGYWHIRFRLIVYSLKVVTMKVLRYLVYRFAIHLERQ